MRGKIFLLGILMGVSFLSTAMMTPVLAADPYGIETTANSANLPHEVAGKGNISEVVGALISAGLSLLGIVFFGLILYAGFRWMIARGEAEHITKAKDTIEAALIGLVLVMAAYAITSFIFARLSATQ